MATPLFVQLYLLLTKTKTQKSSFYWSFVQEIHSTFYLPRHFWCVWHAWSWYNINKTRLSWSEKTSLNCFASNLRRRPDYVKNDDLHSVVRPIGAGVPKTHFRLFLFVICVNDITNVNQKITFILYADDTTLTFYLCSFTNYDLFYCWLCNRCY